MADPFLDMPSLKFTDLCFTAHVLTAIGGVYDVRPEASHLVIHQDGDRDTFEEGIVKFSTMNVGLMFMKTASTQGTAAWLMKQVARLDDLNSSSSKEQFFDISMHPRVYGGGSFEYKFVDVPRKIRAAGGKGRPTTGRNNTAFEVALQAASSAAAASIPGYAAGATLQLSFPELQERFFVGGMQSDVGGFPAIVDDCSSPCYLRPDNGVDHPAIDACIWPDTLLNFKVAAGLTGGLNLLEWSSHFEVSLDQQ